MYTCIFLKERRQPVGLAFLPELDNLHLDRGENWHYFVGTIVMMMTPLLISE